MSIRVVVEINFDYLHDLEEAGHVGKDFAWFLLHGDHYKAVAPREPRGVRVLGKRHHSETLKLEVR